MGGDRLLERSTYLLGVPSAALRRHRQLVGIFLQLPQDVANHLDKHQTLRLRQQILGHLRRDKQPKHYFGNLFSKPHRTHQILCHLDRVHVVRVELERNRLGPVLHLTLDDVVLDAEHLQLRIALGGPIVSALLARLARQPLRNGRLALLCRRLR